MEELKIFENATFGKVRTIVIDNEPWFIGKDVATALGYTNSRKALADHVDDEDKNTVTNRYGIQGNLNMTAINKSGVYSLVFSSKLPTAKAFKHWVTSEILPAIRKTGLYKMPLTPEEEMARGLRAAEKVLARTQLELTQAK